MNRNLATFYEAEERNKLSHFTCQGYDLNGVVQAGANDGEEIENFIRMGIEHLIAFEPLSKPFELLKRYSPPAHIYQVGLHDIETKVTLKAVDGDGKGASMFEVVNNHPEVQEHWSGREGLTGTEEVTLVRFDDWAEFNADKIDLSQYDTLQLDTQGNEMEILIGMGDWLDQFKYLCIELSTEPVYHGETPGREVADWLKKRGYTLDSPIFAHNDCFFVRSDIKPISDETYKGRC